MGNMDTDLSIFTNKNEDGIKLFDRLNMILTNSEYFDVLVGYFRITGFYLLKEKLSNVKEIRILIGLETDNKVIDHVTMDVFEMSGSNATVKIKEKVKMEFNNSKNDNLDMENGIIKFCEWIKSGKLKIRMCYEKNVHAKLYIIRKDPTIIPDQYGYLITGSSNFTHNGLDKNIEFNVELKDKTNVKYALNFFEELWESSREVTQDILNTINNDTWMNKNISPYELFLKMLFVYFEEEIDMRNNKYEWPEGYMHLQYQSDAVTQARKILARHGGVIISDVVGLGKTYISAMLGKLLHGRKLFIVPPVVKDNWESVLSDFGYKKSDKVVSLGLVDKISKIDDLSSYEYIFVDEAHRFRNAASTEFQYLKKICYGKGVILITATPQNNTILDIANLITLFQDSRNSSIIPGNRNIEKYFNDLQKEVKNCNGDASVISKVAAEIRDNVLRHVLIRRTRNEIVKYYRGDLEKQGLSFPIVHDPYRLDYMYDSELESVFNYTIEQLKNYSYARYAPLLYLKNQKRVGSDKARQQNMVGFVKTMLVKRLESSIYAFLESIKRLKKSSEGFCNLYKNGRVVVGAASKTKYNFDDIYGMRDDIFDDFINSHDVDYYESDEFVEDYYNKLKADDEILQNIYDAWCKFNISKRDSKYTLLRDEINKIRKDKQIIIFSEATDTVKYLKRKLKNDFGDIVIDFCGGDTISKKEYIQLNFDPKFKSRGVSEKRILITTDALSEGINLHNASIIFNYDLPWNPTRVMQRVGRINRVGTKNKNLYIYNFFPCANTKEHLSLEDAIKTKIQMFNELLGEDSKTITEDESITSYNLYDHLMMANKLSDENDMVSNAEQMEYIKMINEIYENNPRLAEKINSLPSKIRVARMAKSNACMITFIKQGWIKKFIKNDSGISSEIDFEEAVTFLKSEQYEKGLEIPNDFFEKFKNNNDYYSCLIDKKVEANISSTASPNEKKVRQVLKYLLTTNLKEFDRDFLEKVNSAILRGTLNGNIYKKIKNSIDKESYTNENLIGAFYDNIDEIYLSERKNYDISNSLNQSKVIVLSEYLTEGD